MASLSARGHTGRSVSANQLRPNEVPVRGSEIPPTHPKARGNLNDDTARGSGTSVVVPVTPLAQLALTAVAASSEIHHRGSTRLLEELVEIHGRQCRSFCDVAQGELLRTRMRSTRYGRPMAKFERDLEQEQWMRRRLDEAVQQLADGSADKLGRLMGYTNGGFIREILKGTKPVGKAIVARIESVQGGTAWFAGCPHGATAPPQPAESGPAFSSRALNLAKRFDALTDPGDATKAFARLSNILDVYEAEQREREHLTASAKAPTSAPRKRARQAAPTR